MDNQNENNSSRGKLSFVRKSLPRLFCLPWILHGISQYPRESWYIHRTKRKETQKAASRLWGINQNPSYPKYKPGVGTAHCSDLCNVYQLHFFKNKRIPLLGIFRIFLTETRNQSYRQTTAIAIAMQHPILLCLPILCYIMMLHQLLKVDTDNKSRTTLKIYRIMLWWNIHIDTK
jgi:hypothetical protein